MPERKPSKRKARFINPAMCPKLKSPGGNVRGFCLHRVGQLCCFRLGVCVRIAVVGKRAFGPGIQPATGQPADEALYLRSIECTQSPGPNPPRAFACVCVRRLDTTKANPGWQRCDAIELKLARATRAVRINAGGVFISHR